jgi:hypothetical protein
MLGCSEFHSSCGKQLEASARESAPHPAPRRGGFSSVRGGYNLHNVPAAAEMRVGTALA